jgi:hypothetical protein
MKTKHIKSYRQVPIDNRYRNIPEEIVTTMQVNIYRLFMELPGMNTTDSNAQFDGH